MNDIHRLIAPRSQQRGQLILPRQMAPPDAEMAEDDVNELEEACPVVDEEEDKKCPICSYNSGDGGFIQKMNEIEESLTGTVSPEEIYRIQHQLYDRTVKQPLELQGRKCVEITVDEIRTHYQNHRMNIPCIISKEILFVNEMQRQLRMNQIAVVNVKTGQKRLLLQGIAQWQKLSKHKLELIKFYNGPLSKKGGVKTSGIKPYEFN